MQLSSRDDKLSGPGLVGPADIDAGMVTPRVPNHQVCREDDHISGNGLSIWSKKKATENTSYRWKKMRLALRKVEIISQAFSCLRNSANERGSTLSSRGIWRVIPQSDQQVALWLCSLASLRLLHWHTPKLCVKSFSIHYIDLYLVCPPFCTVVRSSTDSAHHLHGELSHNATWKSSEQGY